MTPGAHRIGVATRPAAEIFADLGAERVAQHKAMLPAGYPLPGPISDKLRELEAAGVVGAQIIYHEDDVAVPGDRVATPARSPWFRRFRRGKA